MMTINLRVVLVSLSLIFSFACGGGGGGDGDGGGGGNGGGGGGDSALNPGLQGRVLTGGPVAGVLGYADAETGEYTVIQNTNWSSQSDRFYRAGIAVFSSSHQILNTTEFLVLATTGTYGSEVWLQGYDGSYHGQIHLDGYVDIARLSLDMQYVALFRRIGSISSIPRLEIYTRDGQLIDYYQEEGFDGRQLFWLNGNRLLYSDGDRFYFTKSLSTEVDYTMVLPDSEDPNVTSRVIGDKSVSPDESQIAFIIVDYFNTGDIKKRLYIVNIDGSNLQLLATTYNDELPNFRAPKWSPDGHWILTCEGATHGSVGGTKGTLYLIPADNPGMVYYVSRFAGEQHSPGVRFFWRYTNLNNPGFGITTDCLDVPTWIAD